MLNRNGFTAIQLLITGVIIGVLLIVLIAVPNALRQTRNSSRTQDAHVLGLLIKEQQLISQTASLPNSCNNTQKDCFSRKTKLSYYDNTSLDETVITYYRDATAFDEKFSPKLDPADIDVTNKVLIHTFAVCGPDGPTGAGAGVGSIAIQYAIETLFGPKLVCKNA
jgi:competence protein ComGC